MEKIASWRRLSGNQEDKERACAKTLRIEIEHRSPKEQVETNVRKNLELSDTLYIIASDEVAKEK